MRTLFGKYANANVYASIVEEEALNQIQTMIDSPVCEGATVAIMPDTHAGAGCTIGTTMTIGSKIVPNWIGVDIGCGMLVVPLGNIDLDLKKVDDVIHKYIPCGMEVNEEILGVSHINELRCYNSLKNVDRLERSLSSLGSGNHFLEIDIDDEGNKYLVIHTGSRNLGKQVAEYYQDIAYENINKNNEFYESEIKNIIETLKAEGRQREISSALEAFRSNFKETVKVPHELCWLEGKDMENYLHDMKICQEFAKQNRRLIAERIITLTGIATSLAELSSRAGESFETIHNYINFEDGVLRKGAVSAHEGEILLIPINMRDGSLICRGKGNKNWNCSAPHGAGRLMSRAEARKKISMEEYAESMKGIFSTCVDMSTIDESPMSYKPIEVIMEDIKDTVEIIKVIQPIYNFKASE